jgi:TRAP-type mannitol/chloroaromatic compound transport system permease large subunit
MIGIVISFAALVILVIPMNLQTSFLTPLFTARMFHLLKSQGLSFSVLSCCK